MAGVEQGDAIDPDGGSADVGTGDERDVPSDALGDLGESPSSLEDPELSRLILEARRRVVGADQDPDQDVISGRNVAVGPSHLTLNFGSAPEPDQPGFELARRVAAIQEQQIQFQMRIQEQELDLRREAESGLREMQRGELELRREAQRGELELRRYALERADENEKAAIQRVEKADDARIGFAHRGQTFTMWLAGSSVFALVGSGIAVTFLAVAGVISIAAGATLAGILLGAALVTALSGMVGRFLPGRSDDELGSNTKTSIETKRDTENDELQPPEGS